MLFSSFFSCSSWATRHRLRCVPSHSETGQRLAFSSFLTQTIPTSNHQTSDTHTGPKSPKPRLSPRHLFNHLTQLQSSVRSDCQRRPPRLLHCGLGSGLPLPKSKALTTCTFWRLYLAHSKSFLVNRDPSRHAKPASKGYACPVQQQGHGKTRALGSRLYKDGWIANPPGLSPSWAVRSTDVINGVSLILRVHNDLSRTGRPATSQLGGLNLSSFGYSNTG